MKILSQKQALIAMVIVLSVVIVFHVLILIQLIPYTIVWAGKLNNVDEMRVFETISILVNILLITVLLLKANYIRNQISSKVLNGIIWAFVIIFSLNTIGNLFSKTQLELYVFTPLTFISAILCWQILRGRKIEN